nr:unnamed protein product [Digitaria exilis]
MVNKLKKGKFLCDRAPLLGIDAPYTDLAVVERCLLRRELPLRAATVHCRERPDSEPENANPARVRRWEFGDHNAARSPFDLQSGQQREGTKVADSLLLACSACLTAAGLGSWDGWARNVVPGPHVSDCPRQS